MGNNYKDDVSFAREIAREVEQRGGRTYYVGGYVRDRLLGRASKDVDIEVHGVSVAELEDVLASFGSARAVGASFGVYNIGGHTLDIAVPRREDAERSAEGKSFESVADPFIGTYKAALRRDLTMNALYEDVLTGEVIDHFGGCDDLARGVIRHVDATTFCEDPLRVLRAAQFAARFGMRVSGNTIELCARLKLDDLAPERVLEELKKALVKSPKPSVFFEVLRAMCQLDVWFGETEALIGVPQNPLYHPEGDVWAHTMLVVDAAAQMREESSDEFSFMLAALCHDFGKAVTTSESEGRIISYGHEVEGVPLATQFVKRLSVATKVRKYVQNMVELHMAPNALVAQGAKQKAFNKLFDRSCCPRDLVLLAHADDRGRGPEADPDTTAEEKLDAHLACFEELMARPYVQGSDLIAAGVEPGPLMGEVLEYAHKLRLAGMSKENQLRQCLGFWRTLQ